MKSTKIFKFKEFSAACENNVRNIHVCELSDENISIQTAEHLFECNVPQKTSHKIENAVIALPYSLKCKITIDSLSLNLTRFLKSQQVQGECGFSLGHYFDGDYKSGDSVWNQRSLCVSLYGDISDRAGTVAVAVEIMRMYNLPRILILTETCVMEITRDGDNQVKPLPQTRIKRLDD